MKKTSIITITLIIISFINANSQTTITLQPNAYLGKDALLHGLSTEANTNYESNNQLAATAWTFSGTSGIVRSSLEFDLSSIPAGATIDHASLSLYPSNSTSGLGTHSTLSGSNASWLQRITSDWNEKTVTWNTQPTTTTTNQVTIPESTYTKEGYLNNLSIDVSNLVQDMIDNPSNSFGFLLRLQNESYYRQVNFVSSDSDIILDHPKLVICYLQEDFIPINSKKNSSDVELNLPSNLTSNFNVEDIDFNLFPNPASSSITIETNNLEQKIDFLQIINSNGQIIEYLTDIQHIISIDLSNYSKGLYFVKNYSNGILTTKKLIIK